MALFAAVREDYRQGMGVRAIARKHGVHRRAVREALASPVPTLRKVPERASPARDSVAPLIDAMLAGDLDAPRKQRHTARRVWTRLRDEHDAGVLITRNNIASWTGENGDAATALQLFPGAAAR